MRHCFIIIFIMTFQILSYTSVNSENNINEIFFKYEKPEIPEKVLNYIDSVESFVDPTSGKESLFLNTYYIGCLLTNNKDHSAKIIKIFPIDDVGIVSMEPDFIWSELINSVSKAASKWIIKPPYYEFLDSTHKDFSQLQYQHRSLLILFQFSLCRNALEQFDEVIFEQVD